MRKLLIYTAAFLYMFLFAQCNSRQEEPVVSNPGFDFRLPLVPVSPYIKPVSVYGEWGYSIPFYTCNLSIKKDGTFSYNSQSCMHYQFCEGTWVRSGQDLILTSFEKYKLKSGDGIPKEKEIPELAYKEVNQESPVKNIIDRSDTALLNYSSITSVKFITGSSIDSTTVYFNNEVYSIHDDVLLQRGNNENAGIIFRMLKSYY